jgi:hypothetical protein
MTEEARCVTFNAKIFIAGPIETAKQILREEMFKGGCVNICPTHYIYRGGEESGYVVELINYPRFPKEIDELKTDTISLANQLLVKTFQGSYTIQFTDETYFFSRRDW